MTVDRDQTRRDEQLERIHAAFAYVPLARYDDVTKLAEYALGEIVSELEQAEARADMRLEDDSVYRVYDEAMNRALDAEARLAKVQALVEDAIQLCDQHISDEQRKETQRRIIEWATVWEQE